MQRPLDSTAVFPVRWHQYLLAHISLGPATGTHSWVQPKKARVGHVASVGQADGGDELEALLGELGRSLHHKASVISIDGHGGVQHPATAPAPAPVPAALPADDMFQFVVQACYSVVMAENQCPASFCRVFQGNLPPSAAQLDGELRDLVLMAYRCGP